MRSARLFCASSLIALAQKRFSLRIAIEANQQRTERRVGKRPILANFYRAPKSGFSFRQTSQRDQRIPSLKFGLSKLRPHLEGLFIKFQGLEQIAVGVRILAAFK